MTEHVGFLGFVMLFGVVAHVIKEVVEIRQTEGAGFHLKHFLLAYPYRTAMMFMTAGGAFLLLLETNQLNMASAFAVGYGIDSAANLFSERVKKIT
jgi:hypothetical protein